MSGTTRVSRYQKGKTRKVKTNLDLLEQETVSGSGTCLAICKSAPHPRQPRQHPTTQFFTGRMPLLPPNQQSQSTEGNSKHWIQKEKTEYKNQTCSKETVNSEELWSQSSVKSLDVSLIYQPNSYGTVTVDAERRHWDSSAKIPDLFHILTVHHLLLLLLTVVGWSIFLRARTAVTATPTDQHGCVDQPCNQHLLHLLCRCYHRHDDCRREHWPKDVFWDSTNVADLCVIWQVAGTHCQGVLSLSDSHILHNVTVAVYRLLFVYTNFLQTLLVR